MNGIILFLFLELGTRTADGGGEGNTTIDTLGRYITAIGGAGGGSVTLTWTGPSSCIP